MKLIQSDIKTMSSTQLGKLLGYEKKEVNRKVLAMFQAEIDGGVITPSNDARGYVDEYYLPEVESQMFAAKWNIQHLRKVVEFFVSSPDPVMALPDFSNPAAAARAWAEQYDITTAAQEQLAIAAPKVEFHDTVVNSINTFSTRDAAKKINQRPIKFGEWLKSNGYMCLNGRASQQYIDQGLFVTHTGVSDSKHSYTQTRMTGKGCAYFANKLFEIKL